MDLQHCPACDEEYVAGATSCAECGGPLTAGPLARLEAAARGSSVEAAPATRSLDRLLARLPGRQADQAARALVMEGLSCRAECQGLEKTYTPERPPAEAFAVSLDVALYVHGDDLESAQAVLDSFAHDDLIGNQWDEVEGRGDGGDARPAERHADGVAEDVPAGSGPSVDDRPIEPEGTSLRTAALIVAIALLLLFLFGR
jgi:hypothetical protein